MLQNWRSQFSGCGPRWGQGCAAVEGEEIAGFRKPPEAQNRDRLVPGSVLMDLGASAPVAALRVHHQAGHSVV